jgi:hypothetical protein
VYVCPFDAHWCDLPACRMGACEITTTQPLIACLGCGAVIASLTGFRLCFDCFDVQPKETMDGD